MLKRLRLKFVIINMSIVMAMLCIIFAMVLHFTQQNLERSSLGMLQAMAADNIRPGRPGEMPERVNLPFFIIENGPNGVISVKGSEQFDLSDEAFISELIKISEDSDSGSGVIDEYGLRFFRSPHPMGERLVFGDISIELDTMRALRRSCLMIGLMSFFVFLGISVLLARWAVQPVERTWNEQKQFIADASHELKTPLTVISANAEFLLDESYNEESRRVFADSILTMSKHMRSLVESLLELARTDGSADSRLLREVALSELLTDAALPLEALFFESDLELQCNIEERLYVMGREEHLRQLAEILLDNAGKYSSRPGTVRLSLTRQSRQALICVASPGEEIPRSELKNIFKRFYRLD